MKILIGCEYSARVRDAFRKRGHDAWSCDLLECEGDSNYHIQGDIRDELQPNRWDMLIAFPDCTFLCSSGMHWTTRGLRDPQLTEKALAFFELLLYSPIPKKCLENPVGIVSSRIRKPDQIIQPYEFGEDASKKTCLWLQNLPPLLATKFIPPRIINGKPRWGNQLDSGQNKLGPSDNRWKERARTYQGVADAMAEWWG